MWDGVEVGVEDPIIHPKRMDDMLAVVMLTAASVCILKHSYAQEQNFNSTTYQRTKDLWIVNLITLQLKEINHLSELS